MSHFKVLAMVVPRNLNESISSTCYSPIANGGKSVLFFLKSMIISFVFATFRSKSLLVHQSTTHSTFLCRLTRHRWLSILQWWYHQRTWISKLSCYWTCSHWWREWTVGEKALTLEVHQYLASGVLIAESWIWLPEPGWEGNLRSTFTFEC